MKRSIICTRSTLLVWHCPGSHTVHQKGVRPWARGSDALVGPHEATVYLEPMDFLLVVTPPHAGPQGVVTAYIKANCCQPLLQLYLPSDLTYLKRY